MTPAEAHALAEGLMKLRAKKGFKAVHRAPVENALAAIQQAEQNRDALRRHLFSKQGLASHLDSQPNVNFDGAQGIEKVLAGTKFAVSGADLVVRNAKGGEWRDGDGTANMHYPSKEEVAGYLDSLFKNTIGYALAELVRIGEAIKLNEAASMTMIAAIAAGIGFSWAGAREVMRSTLAGLVLQAANPRDLRAGLAKIGRQGLVKSASKFWAEKKHEAAVAVTDRWGEAARELAYCLKQFAECTEAGADVVEGVGAKLADLRNQLNRLTNYLQTKVDGRFGVADSLSETTMKITLHAKHK